MSEKKNEQQLKRAYQLRDFEIQMYWKRAQYFWSFLAVTYAGFFVVLSKIDTVNSFSIEYLLALSSIGVIFSFAWFLVNKGSKRWQEHWESIIVDFEKLTKKPLYSIKVDIKDEFFNAGYFSVSRINIVVSFLVFLSWIGLWLFSSIKYNSSILSSCIIGVLTLLSIILIYYHGKRNK